MYNRRLAPLVRASRKTSLSVNKWLGMNGEQKRKQNKTADCPKSYPLVRLYQESGALVLLYDPSTQWCTSPILHSVHSVVHQPNCTLRPLSGAPAQFYTNKTEHIYKNVIKMYSVFFVLYSFMNTFFFKFIKSTNH
ncbi:hypothetical protein Btru_011710 [Bulinus truncatus]|nr:hypothetical protein Btru_011710 [Bulinus truncatus]